MFKGDWTVVIDKLCGCSYGILKEKLGIDLQHIHNEAIWNVEPEQGSEHHGPWFCTYVQGNQSKSSAEQVVKAKPWLNNVPGTA